MLKTKKTLFAIGITVLLLASACAKPSETTVATTAPATTTRPVATTTAAPGATPSPTATAGAPQSGGTLKIIANSSPPAIGYPAQMSGPARASVMPALQSIIEADADGRPRAGLATAWQVAADQKSVTLSLRKGVKFHDGTDFNAAAAKWNMDKAMAAKLEGTETWNSIDAVDDSTVRINLKQFQNTLFSYLASLPSAQVSPTATDKNGVDWARLNVVSTGPFKFVSFTPTVELKFVRFDGYYGQKPYLDAIEYMFITDATTRSLAFQRGDAHIYQPDAKDIADLTPKGFQILTRPGMANLSIFAADSANPDSPFKDLRVREALEYAIDRVAIAKSVGRGQWDAASQPAPAGHAAADPTVQGRSYDPQKAKELLAAAGFPNGFKTRLITTATNDGLVAMQTQLKEVGIDAAMEITTTPNWSNFDLRGWKNGLISQTMGADLNWNFLLTKFISPDSRRIVSTQRNFPGASELFQKALTETDFDKSLALTRQVVKFANDNAIVLPLWSIKSTYAIAPTVHDTGYLYSGNVFQFTPEKIWLGK